MEENGEERGMEWRGIGEKKSFKGGIGRINEQYEMKPKGSSVKVTVKVRARAMVGYRRQTGLATI